MTKSDKTPVINVLVTADYELFLGRNFVSDDEVLFTPTRDMVSICDELKVPITFFADICSVWAHRKFGLNDYADKFEKQMIEVNQGGHDVQLHLHPHWWYSNHENGKWNISTEKMYLAELGYGTDDNSAPIVIKRGVDYLNELLQSQNPAYHCIAFRAAGLALQPNEKELISALIDNGITIDSSIVKGIKFNLDTIEIDYSKTPEAANWYLSPEIGIERPSKEGIFEIPIATFRSGLVSRIGFLLRRAQSMKMRRGSGISRSKYQTRMSNLKTMIAYNLRYLYTNPYFSFSCDTKGYNLEMLLKGFDDYIVRHRDNDQLFVSMINHPKLLFEPQLELLRALIVNLRERYREKIRFVTVSKAWEMIGLEKGK